MKMNVERISPEVGQPPANADAAIALMGRARRRVRGHFPRRLGYRNVTIYEREEEFVGGLSSSEIPGYRLPYEAVKWEVELAKDIGVKVLHGQEMGRDFTVDSLREEGKADALLVATGLPEPQRDDCFAGLTPEDNGFWTSKDFLPSFGRVSRVCAKAAGAACQSSREMLWCSGPATRHLAARRPRSAVVLTECTWRSGKAFRERAVPEEVELAVEEKCEFLPFMQVRDVSQMPTGAHSDD